MAAKCEMKFVLGRKKSLVEFLLIHKNNIGDFCHLPYNVRVPIPGHKQGKGDTKAPNKKWILTNFIMTLGLSDKNLIIVSPVRQKIPSELYLYLYRVGKEDQPHLGTKK